MPESEDETGKEGQESAEDDSSVDGNESQDKPENTEVEIAETIPIVDIETDSIKPKRTVNKKAVKIGIGVVTVLAVGIISFVATGNMRAYGKGQKLMKQDKYTEAIATFTELDGYKDSKKLIEESNYQIGMEAMEAKQYNDALKTFDLAGKAQKVQDAQDECNYQIAMEWIGKESYDDAINILGELADKDYKDSNDQLITAKYDFAHQYMDNKEYNKAKDILKNLNYKDSDELVKECEYQRGIIVYDAGKRKDAMEIWQELKYKDSDDLAKKCKYELGVEAYNAENIETAVGYLDGLDYQDSVDILTNIENSPRSLSNFIVRYNNMVDEIETAGVTKLNKISAEQVHYSEIVLQSGAIMHFNNDDDPDCKYIITNVTYTLNPFYSEQIITALSEIYAMFGGFVPGAVFSDMGPLYNQLQKNPGKSVEFKGASCGDYSGQGNLLLSAGM